MIKIRERWDEWELPLFIYILSLLGINRGRFFPEQGSGDDHCRTTFLVLYWGGDSIFKLYWRAFTNCSSFSNWTLTYFSYLSNLWDSLSSSRWIFYLTIKQYIVTITRMLSIQSSINIHKRARWWVWRIDN